MAKVRPIPRDLVLVIDTSSSMLDEKLRQAKSALTRALDSLGPDDRFALVSFATTTEAFRKDLSPPGQAELREARAWVEELHANGATDISAALERALAFGTQRRADRALQVVFLTDGLPTAGLTDRAKILEIVNRREAEGVRFYTFGVGDDVDAHLLDLLAETSHGCSTYVRPAEDLEEKVAAFSARIQRPVGTDLKLETSGGPRLTEIYPPRLPDLFQGEQVQVAGRFEGHGPAALTLKGRAGDQAFSETFEVNFPETQGGSDFIAPLWARRKAGYLLDQIRLNGESSELKTELVQLAHDFSIATPYTSLLVIPEPSAPGSSARRRPPAGRRRSSFSSFPLGGFGGVGGGTGGFGGMGGGMGGMGGGMGGMGGGMGGMSGGMPRLGGMGGMMGGMGTGPSIAGRRCAQTVMPTGRHPIPGMATRTGQLPTRERPANPARP